MRADRRTALASPDVPAQRRREHLDAFEQTLYNGYLSGVSQAGDTFFYQNPLESDAKVERSAYFDVACCPANLARLMAQVPGLVYATRGADVFVNHFIASDATIDVGGTRVTLAQRTGYPWRGDVAITVTPATPVDMTLWIRIPGWARNTAFVSEPVSLCLDRRRGARAPRERRAWSRLSSTRGFARITRRWSPGDRVALALAHAACDASWPRARSTTIAARRPSCAGRVYAFEAIDNGGSALDLHVPLDAPLRDEFRGDLLGGVQVVTGRRDIATRIAADGARHPVRSRGRIVARARWRSWVATARP